MEHVDFGLFWMAGVGFAVNNATWPLVARILPEDENVGLACWGFGILWTAFFVAVHLIVRGMQ